MSKLNVFDDIKEWQSFRNSLKGELGFVPTLGALHEGHLSLVKRAKKENATVCVSIFLNPTQFNNKSDLESYPTNISKDLKLLENVGVDHVILPSFQQLYPDNYKYKVSESQLSGLLCGKDRPGHFDGVLSVVMKLFNIVRPRRAYFGEKDFQQLLLIKGMVDSFFMDVDVIACPTVREKDGLAMSSRNLRLSETARKRAAQFPQLLMQAEDPEAVKDKLTGAGFDVVYVEDLFGRRFGAVNFENVRLIDNLQKENPL